MQLVENARSPTKDVILDYQLKSELALHSRQRKQIANEINLEPVRHGDTLQSNALRHLYTNGRHRPTEPSRRYNCHGFTFACKRTWITEAQTVQQILIEDDYEIVPFREVMPGDVAIYRTQNGDIEHSGLVVNVNDLKVPEIVSKWGAMHEVIHQVGQCPYDTSNVMYYRIKK